MESIIVAEQCRVFIGMSIPSFSGAALGCALAGSAAGAVGQPGLWNGVTRLAVDCAVDPAITKGLGNELCVMITGEVARRSPYPTHILVSGAAAAESRDLAIMKVRIGSAGDAGALRLAITMNRALEADDSEGARTQPALLLPAGATAAMPATRDIVARAVTRALPRTNQREARAGPGPFTRFR